MDEFSFGGAWRAGWEAVAERFWLYAAILIGLGVILPIGLQFVVLGTINGANPLTGGGGVGVLPGLRPGMPNGAAAGGANPAVTLPLVLAGYVLQAASYFACWRLALGRTTLGGGLGFGLVAGLLATVTLIVAVALAFGITRLVQAEPSAGAVLVPLLLLPFMVLIALYYTTLAATMAAFVSLAIAFTMLFGTLLGNAGLAATLFGGGSGLIAVVYLVLCFVLLWLASRLCCVAPLLAAWRSLNLVAAMRESWRLTYEDRWPILRYLFLVGVAIALFFLVLIGGGAALATTLFRADAVAVRLAGMALGFIVGLPFALLAMMIPAGIYRDLTRSDQAAEVFT